MQKRVPLLALVPLTFHLTGCAASAERDPSEASDTSEIAQAPRVFGFVKDAWPAGDLDGADGAECAVLVQPEHRLRQVILLEAVAEDGTCALSVFSPGSALSFAWSDTAAEGAPAVVARVRAAFASVDATVATLRVAPVDEGVAAAALAAYLASETSKPLGSRHPT